ncbi:hypothetical protein NFA_6590 [Nocardia farcinica IFM 10152]|uniref:Uncharacterized protein n=1 Tax=Nocardia farcinica (strain IFM 10152) TaxID=247156 RepID=Q5Z237_NOCFA|nr:hypothetical protein NFA_6590 [Nocardia farcinica IFM 10152]
MIFPTVSAAAGRVPLGGEPGDRRRTGRSHVCAAGETTDPADTASRTRARARGERVTPARRRGTGPFPTFGDMPMTRQIGPCAATHPPAPPIVRPTRRVGARPRPRPVLRTGLRVTTAPSDPRANRGVANVPRPPREENRHCAPSCRAGACQRLASR